MGKQSEQMMSCGANTADQRLAQEAFTRIGQLLVATPIEALRRASGKTNETTCAKKGPAVSASKRWQKGFQKVKLVSLLNTRVTEVRSRPVCPNAASAVQMGPKLEAVFDLIDADQSGLLDIQEFVNGIWFIPGVSDIKLSNGEALTKQRLQSLARMLEHSSGGISMLGFLEALCFEDAAGDGMADSLAEHMLTVLFRHRQSVRQAAHCFDAGGLGKITLEEFEKVLLALNKILSEDEPNSAGSAFSASQVVHLCSSIADDSGMASYEDFFDSFEVVDRENPTMGVRLGRHKPGDINVIHVEV